MPEFYSQIAGWDIGGAHVKLAYVNNGKLSVHQWDCPLWKGLDRLTSVLSQAHQVIPVRVIKHHVTMTGEMVDIFQSHSHGVEQIMEAFIQNLPGLSNSDQDNIKFYSSMGLLTWHKALDNLSNIASANWIASAELIGQKTKNCVLVDMGSTTTDILHINDQGLVFDGLSDFDRLNTGELVYTGVVRSCVNTFSRIMPYKDKMVPLMAENFATSADIYRILEWLPEHADYGATMDGGAKDISSSMTRLARMIGKDYCSQDKGVWVKASEYLAAQQMQMIEKVILSIKQENHITDIVGAGVGAFLIEKIAQTLSLNYKDFSQCVVPPELKYNSNVSDCAPAVALLFMNSNTH